MSVSSVASQSVFLNTSTSVTKNSDSSKIVSASPDMSNTSATSSVDATISTKWGFKVDGNGFFGADFNKVAGIPANIKINQKQMEMVEEYSKITASSDDPIKALGKVWNFFSKVAGSTLDSDGTMTISQVSKMPKGFEFDGSLLDNPISIQQTQEEYLQASKVSGDIQGLSNNTFQTGFRTFFGENILVGDNIPNIKGIYQNYISPNYDQNESQDQINVGELFGVFCYQTMNGMDKDTFDATKAYYSFVESGQDFKSYLTDKFGADYVKNLADGMNTHFKDPDMFDTLMKEIDRHNKANYTSYLSSQNTIADSILSQSDNTTSTNSTLSSAYQGIKNVKLPSAGSLINIGI